MEYALIRNVSSDPSPGDNFGESANHLQVGYGLMLTWSPLIRFVREIGVDTLVFVDEETVRQMKTSNVGRILVTVISQYVTLAGGQKDIASFCGKSLAISKDPPLTLLEIHRADDVAEKAPLNTLLRIIENRGDDWATHWVCLLIAGIHAIGNVSMITPARFA